MLHFPQFGPGANDIAAEIANRPLLIGRQNELTFVSTLELGNPRLGRFDILEEFALLRTELKLGVAPNFIDQCKGARGQPTTA